MSNEIVYLEPDEEITSVIDRLRKTPGAGVALVIPRGSTLAQSIVNLKLLKKSAEGMDKSISFVSNDRIARNLASQLGISVYSKVSEAEKAKPIDGPRPKVGVANVVDGKAGFRINDYSINEDEGGEIELEPPADESEGMPEELDVVDEAKIDRKPELPEEEGSQEDDDVKEDLKQYLEEKEPEAKFDKRKVEAEKNKEEAITGKGDHNSGNGGKYNENREPSHKNINSHRKPLIIVACVVLVALIIASYITLPYARANVTLSTEDYTSETQIAVDSTIKNIDLEGNRIPGQILESVKEETRQFEATGKKDIGAKASGTITFANSAGVDETIATGTTVRSSGGVSFTLESAIAVPKAYLNANGDKVNGTIAGKINAVESGAEGNLSVGTDYTVSGHSKVTASGATTGGTTQEVKIVTSADLDNAEEAVKQTLLDSSKNELSNGAETASMVFSEKAIATEILTSDSSKKENEQSDTFEYTVKSKTTVLAFAEGDILNIARQQIVERLGENKMLISPDKAEVKYEIVATEAGGAILTLDVSFSGKVADKLDTDSIKKAIKNQSTKSASSIIKANNQVIDVTYSIWPSFIKRLPILPSRIKVEFGYQN
jgi:hypothetical protein